ncbi:MAG: hypothetical protein ACK55Z_05735 [bacterium]
MTTTLSIQTAREIHIASLSLPRTIFVAAPDARRRPSLTCTSIFQRQLVGLPSFVASKPAAMYSKPNLFDGGASLHTD